MRLLNLWSRSVSTEVSSIRLVEASGQPHFLPSAPLLHTSFAPLTSRGSQKYCAFLNSRSTLGLHLFMHCEVLTQMFLGSSAWSWSLLCHVADWHADSVDRILALSMKFSRRCSSAHQLGRGVCCVMLLTGTRTRSEAKLTFCSDTCARTTNSRRVTTPRVPSSSILSSRGRRISIPS